MTSVCSTFFKAIVLPDRWLVIYWDQASTAGQDIEYLKAALNNPDKNLSSELTQDPGVQHFSCCLNNQQQKLPMNGC